jgi:predicted component of type VI protein secretion system
LARLIIYEESQSGATAIFETFTLAENRVTIGSDQDNQLVLDVPDVDPMHASLELRDNHWFLQDLGGLSGTSINGALIEGPRMLNHDDVIDLGFIKMKFQSDDDRGATQEFETYAPEDTSSDDAEAGTHVQLSGRVWFAGLAILTSIVIFAIFMLFVAAHLLGLINILDLLPAAMGGN